MGQVRWWESLGNLRRLASPRLPNIETSTDEGELITMQAVLLGLKNRILVATLTTDATFEVTRFVPDAREVVAELVAETRLQSARLDEERRRVAQLAGTSLGMSDYRQGDQANLRHRRDVLTRIADRLERNVSKETWVADLVERAREMAWAEMSRELELTLQRKDRMIFGDDNYEAERDERLAEFLSLDLRSLQEGKTGNKRKKGKTGKTVE